MTIQQISKYVNFKIPITIEAKPGANIHDVLMSALELSQLVEDNVVADCIVVFNGNQILVKKTDSVQFLLDYYFKQINE